MKMNEYVDVLIPRGGRGLIKAVVNNSTIPVIETGTGNCHIYVDESADLQMAANIVMNAKTQRVGVCNACESLLVHEKVKDAFLPVLAQSAFVQKHVEMRADEEAKALIPDAVHGHRGGLGNRISGLHSFYKGGGFCGGSHSLISTGIIPVILRQLLPMIMTMPRNSWMR